MKRLILIVAMIAPLQSMAGGIPVADIPAFAQRVSEARLAVDRWRTAIKEAAATASTVSNTYQALTKVTNLHDVMRSPELNKFLPNDYLSIYNDALDLGLGGLFGGSLDLYESQFYRDVCRATQKVKVKSNCQARVTSSYKLQHASNMAYENSVRRADQIERLTAKMETAETPKQILDLQTLIDTEIASIQNDSFRLEALRSAHEASKASLEQQQDQLASEIWDEREGIVLEPIGFGN